MMIIMHSFAANARLMDWPSKDKFEHTRLLLCQQLREVLHQWQQGMWCKGVIRIHSFRPPNSAKLLSNRTVCAASARSLPLSTPFSLVAHLIAIESPVDGRRILSPPHHTMCIHKHALVCASMRIHIVHLRLRPLLTSNAGNHINY